MPAPIEIVRAELGAGPREHEDLDLGEVGGWSEADKRAAVRELLDAAAHGDARVPAALTGLLPVDELRLAYESLLASAPPGVRVEAGWRALELLQRSLARAVLQPLREGQLLGHAQTRAIQLLAAAGAEPALRAALTETTHEDVRTAIIEQLWDRHGLATFPSVPWSGLGLLRWQLATPFASFRQEQLPTLFALLDGVPPATLGYAPQSGPMPRSLADAMSDLDSGRGPLPEALLSSLAPDPRQALLCYAAEQLRSAFNARALEYLAWPGGARHRDVLEWAAHGPAAALVEPARATLARLS